MTPRAGSPSADLSADDQLAVDQSWMALALDEARAAGAAGDVPVGAVLVDGHGQLLAAGQNRRERDADPTAHAEVVALRRAAHRRGAWRLSDSTMYVTLEPCPMCAGALVNGRIARLVYGCADPKAGAVKSLFNIGTDERLNHRLVVVTGVCETACRELLRAFFAERRRGREQR